MKKKQLKRIAEKIAKAEYIIQTSTDKKAVKKAEQDIMELSGSVHDLEDMAAVDELVQELLSKQGLTL